MQTWPPVDSFAAAERAREDPARPCRARRRRCASLCACRYRLYAHADTGRVSPLTQNVEQVVEGYATLKKLATSRVHVVLGHDPPVLATYPAAKPGIEGWVERLDVASRG
jgi:hypothetical protein